MKLTNIVERMDVDLDDDQVWNDDHKERFYPEYQDKLDAHRKEYPNRKFIGAGAFSYIDQDQSPHEMDNVHRTHTEELDGGTLWYQMIINTPNASSNPFLPRVISKGRSNGFPTFQVEKLYPLSKISNDQHILDVFMRQVFGTTNPEVKSNWDFSEMIFSAVDQTSGIKLTPQFQRVASMINRLMDLHPDLGLDIHAGNLMVRITGNMPQLVVVDPLVNDKLMNERMYRGMS